MNENQKEFERQSPDKDLVKSAPAYPEALSDPDPFIAMVERLGSNPNVDVDKLERILAMNERVLDRNQRAAFNDSFAKAQSKIDLVVADSYNVQTKSNYPKLSRILIEAKKHWESEGFGMMYYEGECPIENHKRTMCDIRHSAGHTETRHIDLAVQTTGIAGKQMMTQIHGQGSSFSYGRRYLTCMIWNIPTGDDDDGQKASENAEFITEDQAKDITRRLKKIYGDDASMFLNWIGVDTVDTILAKDYKKAIGGIKTAEKAAQKPHREPGMDDK